MTRPQRTPAEKRSLLKEIDHAVLRGGDEDQECRLRDVTKKELGNWRILYGPAKRPQRDRRSDSPSDPDGGGGDLGNIFDLGGD